jgi:6-bladed beta-propeller
VGQNQSQWSQERRLTGPRGPMGKTRLRRVAVAVLVAGCTVAAVLASASASPPTAVTEAATAVKYEEATLKGTVNPEGSSTSYWFEYGETTSYGSKVPTTPQSIGSGTVNVLVKQIVTGLKESTTYHFRVVAESEGKTVPGEDTSFTTNGFNFAFGESGSGDGQLSEPHGVAVDSKGNVWVTDTANNRVEEFNSAGEYVSKFGKEGTGNGEFKAPKGISIDSEDHIWIVDSSNARVQEFNSKGEYVSKFGKEGIGQAEFKSPSGIATIGTGPNIYVADTGNNRVQKFNSSGKWLATIGKEGNGDGEFKSPTGVVIETSGIWITDTGNNRVQRFNTNNLSYSRKFGEEGSGKGQFKSPTGITSDFQDRLWIVDSGNDRAQKFDLDGEFQDQTGKSGSSAGQFSNPIGVVTPAGQKVLVVDSGNNRVEGWSVKAEPPKVVKRAATGLTATTAILHANIDPEALATSYWVEYGETKAYGSKVPINAEAIGSGSGFVEVSQTATGLSAGTTYHFRAIAESSAGEAIGEDKTFKLIAPTVTTESATAVKATQATLNGKVNPESSATVYWFEYGKTEHEGYEAKIPLTPESVGSGGTNVTVSQTPTGLSKNTEYRFRVVAENEGGTSFGKDEKFKTEP